MKTPPVALPSHGPPTTRIEGIAKVTGRADYTADAVPPNLAHAVLVGATIAHGTLATLDTTEARSMPGASPVWGCSPRC